ncbi:MAG TPA: nitroreductase family protein [bacterium]|nr:nitroreductase family protein [bacterium]HPR87495.1 nitroreductase family protein [bacterium]
MGALLQIIQARRSVRRFTGQPVARTVLQQCLEAARLAPSAENVQPWRFLIVDDPAVKERLAAEAFSGLYRVTRWAEKAPVLVVLFAELDVLANRLGKQVTGIDYYLIDSGIAGEHFCLQAAELGVGSCWIGWFSPQGVRRALGTPRGLRPVAMFALGYSAHANTPEKKRRPAGEIGWYNRIGEPL